MFGPQPQGPPAYPGLPPPTGRSGHDRGCQQGHARRYAYGGPYDRSDPRITEAGAHSGACNEADDDTHRDTRGSPAWKDPA